LLAQVPASLPATEPTVRGVAQGAGNNWTYFLDEKNRIAYVQVSAFTDQTNKELEQVLRTLTKAELKGLVLDLRFNAGGPLPAVVKCADLLIDDGLIVTVRAQVGPETSYVGKSDGSYLAFPIACLINRDTAAGAEFLAACLQDHARAVLIGERTTGEAGRTRFGPADPLSAPKPSPLYLRPSGKNLHKASTAGRPDQDWGVRPDSGYEVVLTDAERAALYRRLGQAKRAAASFQDRQLERAREYLRLQIATPGKKRN
jgi:carboxyl-terminal processing protease